MKILDVQQVFETAQSMIIEAQPLISEKISTLNLSWLLTNIYEQLDQTKEQTTRFKYFGTIITTQKGCSIILDTKQASNSTNDSPLVAYEDLETDLTNILSIIDITYIRAEDN